MAISYTFPLVQVQKRDGTLQSFDRIRLERAIALCFLDIHQLPQTRIQAMVQHAVETLVTRHPTGPWEVEAIQDAVEDALVAAGERDAARHYMRYRLEHEAKREQRPISEPTRAAFDRSLSAFPTPIQQFMFFDKYARFDLAQGRRETWDETVWRATDYLMELVQEHTGDSVLEEVIPWSTLREAIRAMKVMPSMRLLAMAGPAARRQNLSIYNCSAMPVADLRAFPEALLISMAGCGVGFSVERQFVEQFPRIQRQSGKTPVTWKVEDSTEGWARALTIGLEYWFRGEDVTFDYSAIRPAGAILKTKGGRASGPEPLRLMLDGVRSRVLARQGSFLRPIDAHDLMCLVGNAAVMGGTRRTAMISLFDWDDLEMRHCKDGDLTGNEQRWNANNSAVWPERGLTQVELLEQFLDMAKAGRGEPGIFNRASARALRPARREDATFLTNPCGEVILRPYGLCNLSIAVARREDTLETLAEKVRLATIIGTIQSLATHFPGLRDEWRRNAEQERLLGVDITGQQDCPLLTASTREECLSFLRQVAIDTNAALSLALGIHQSVAVTCVKPSGNSSQLLNCASGLHPRWAPYYLRNIRVGKHTPLYQVLKDAGAPMQDEVGPAGASTAVISFPVKAPEGAVTRHDLSALDQCEHWLANKRHYTEHNPSVTVTYKPDELLDVVRWVWEHQQEIGGMAFLPASDANYALMPYQEITQAEYEMRMAIFPEIDYAKLVYHEDEDWTSAAQEAACLSGACEL